MSVISIQNYIGSWDPPLSMIPTWPYQLWSAARLPSGSPAVFLGPPCRRWYPACMYADGVCMLTALMARAPTQLNYALCIWLRSSVQQWASMWTRLSVICSVWRATLCSPLPMQSGLPQCTNSGLHALHNKCAEFWILHLVDVAAVFILINSIIPFVWSRECCKHHSNDPKYTTNSRDLLLLGADVRETVSHVNKVTILITVLLTYNI